jgi:hypothetical protein
LKKAELPRPPHCGHSGCFRLFSLHGSPARAGCACFTIIKLCGGFYNSKKQNLFKKTDKKPQQLHKTKIKSRNTPRTLFFKALRRLKAVRKRMSFVWWGLV